MTTATVRERFNGGWLATFVCCVGVVVTGLSLENSVYRLSIASALCVGLLCYALAVCSSRMKAATLLVFSSVLFVLVFVGLAKDFGHLPLFSPWPHRIYRVWWLSECAAIILALVAVGVLAIEAVGYIGGDTTRRRFQWCVTAAASILVIVNITNLFRPISCYDCFFPYGVPFTFFAEGGYGGGGGFVWHVLACDAALILAIAALCALLWNRIAR